MGYLSCERGVHRLVRISPFDANKRRHTSFAAVDVLPVLEDIDVELKETELRGHLLPAGGRRRRPERQQGRDRRPRQAHAHRHRRRVRQRAQPAARTSAMALSILQAKIERLEQAKRDQEMEKLYGDRGEIAWGNQIRSYVLDDRRVKDHRTGVETGNPERVLDGDLQSSSRPSFATGRSRGRPDPYHTLKSFIMAGSPTSSGGCMCTRAVDVLCPTSGIAVFRRFPPIL